MLSRYSLLAQHLKDFSLLIKSGFVVLLFLAGIQFLQAQPVRKSSVFSTTEYKNYDKYYERITYVGKRKDLFIVETYLKDSTLYRVDNYRYIELGNLSGVFAVRHGPSKILYGDGRLYLTCDYNMNVLNGAFIVYYTDGSIKRRELYKNGRLKKGVCYTPDGVDKTCEAFYQQIQFMGNRKELTDYFAKNLDPLIDGILVRGVIVKLVINEIGQVIDVLADAGRNNLRTAAAIKRLVQDMPRWRENESNWKPASMDGVATPGVWIMNAYRDRNIVRVNLPAAN